MEVPVHPAGRRGLRRPPSRAGLQECAALHEPVPRQLVERVVRATAAHPLQQGVDEREGVRGIGTGPPTRGRGPHDLLQTGVYESQERPERAALGRRELGAAAVAALDPGVQGVAGAADDGDGAAVGGGQGRGDGDAECGQAFGGAVLAGDGGRVGGLGVEVVLEEVAAARGGEPVAAVEQALVDGFAGQR